MALIRGLPRTFKYSNLNNKKVRGLTLLELLIAITILTGVLLTASAVLSSFKKYYFDFVQRESDIQDVSMGVLEEMGNRIKVANRITITANADLTDITVFVDAGTPGDPADDSMHEYLWTKADETIRYSAANPTVSPKTIAKNISAFSAALLPDNTVEMDITVSPDAGAAQTFKSIVVAYSHAA
jgi:type II secretory pathway pseudopilin PulG